jgi:hypothetical protein
VVADLQRRSSNIEIPATPAGELRIRECGELWLFFFYGPRDQRLLDYLVVLEFGWFGVERTLYLSSNVALMCSVDSDVSSYKAMC